MSEPKEERDPRQFPTAEVRALPSMFASMKRRGMAEEREDGTWWLTEKGAQMADDARKREPEHDC